MCEVPYTKDTLPAASTGCTPDIRRSMLRRLIKAKKCVRVIEASNGLSALISERAQYTKGIELREFDALWVSSLCDSTFKGKPDIELVDFSSRLATVNEIMEVSTKPVIFDGDTGGRVEHFAYCVKTLERLGVSAVIIEDKTGLKQNSLLGAEVLHELEDVDAFSEKIRAGKKAQVTRDFMIIARLESLIAGIGLEDALCRAKAYITAGCDAIMIHSAKEDGGEIFEFMNAFRKFSHDIPVVLVPTSYNSFTEEEFSAAGANVVIYANHLLRSAYPAMLNTANSILAHGRSLEASNRFCAPVKEIVKLIPGVYHDQ